KRFHRRVRGQWRVVRRLDDRSVLRELRIDVSVVPDDGTRPVHGIHELLLELDRVEGTERAVLPLNLQALAPLQHGPGAAADHRDTAEWFEPPRQGEWVERDRFR